MITLLLPRKKEDKKAKTYRVLCDTCHTSQFTSAGTVNREGAVQEADIRGWKASSDTQICPKCVTNSVGPQRAVPSSPERVQASVQRTKNDVAASQR